MADPKQNAAAFTSPGRVYRWSMRLLVLIALAVTALLLVASFSEEQHVLGCGSVGVSGCDSALASRWSKWLGLPISTLAAVNYLVILGALTCIGPARSPRQQRMAWLILLVCTLASSSAAVWFYTLMFMQLGFCSYCLTVHGCGMVLTLLVLIRAPIRLRPMQAVAIGPSAAGLCALVAFAGLVGLISGQWFFNAPKRSAKIEQPTIDTEIYVSSNDEGATVHETLGAPAVPDREVFLLNRKIRVKPHELPVLGSPDAPYVVLSLFDYTCKYCRIMHERIAKVRQRYGEKLAIVALPVPLHPLCNKNITRTHPSHRHACALAQLAMRVWLSDPTKFEQFDNWLFAPEKPPVPDAAKKYAIELVGEEKFEATKYQPWPRRQIDRNTTLHDKLPRSSLPVIVADQQISFGLPEAEELYKLLEEDLEIEPLPTAP